MGGSDVVAASAPARRLGIETIVPLVVIAIDQATKAWIRATLDVNESIRVLGDTIRITYIHNEGAAFGLNVGEHSSIVFLVLAVAASGLVLYLFLTTNQGERLQRIALALILGGAFGIGPAGFVHPLAYVNESVITFAQNVAEFVFGEEGSQYFTAGIGRFVDGRAGFVEAHFVRGHRHGEGIK